MTPRERVLTALGGGTPDRVPFSLWDTRLFAHEIEPMLATDACIVVRSHVYRVEYEDIQTDTQHWHDAAGNQYTRTVYHTRAGDLQQTAMFSPEHATTWLTERLFKGFDDYDRLIELVMARRYIPTYDQFANDDRRYGERSLGRPAPIRTPMFEIQYDLMGTQRFCMELIDRPDAVEALYGVILERRCEAVDVLAASPAQYAVIEGNVTFEVVGADRFRRYYMPPIAGACEQLHAKGILTGAHLDGNMAHLAPLIAETPLDVIEAFTPPPDCDLPVAEARELWPDKAIYLNFPSSLHHHGRHAVLDAAREILAQAAPGDRFVLGATEDTPTNDHLVALAELTQDVGRTPLPRA